MRGTRGDQAWDESVEVGGFGGDEERIAFQSMGHLVDLEVLNERFCGGIRPAHVELRIKRLSGWARRRGWPLNCGVLLLTINGASRFLREWPAATVDSEPPEALWPAVKGQAGSLARVRGHPLHRAAITRKGGPASSGRRAISGPLTGVKRVLSRSLTDSPFRRSAHIEGPDCTDSQADSSRLQIRLQFTVVRSCPGRTGQERWSSLNRSGRQRPELLMRLGLATIGTGAATRAAMPPDGAGSRCTARPLSGRRFAMASPGANCVLLIGPIKAYGG